MSETPETPAHIRVVIADDHPVVRTGLRLMLQMRQEFELVGEAADGASAVRLVGGYSRMSWSWTCTCQAWMDSKPLKSFAVIGHRWP